MHSSDRSIRLFIIILLLSIGSVVTQLVVNVKNGGGDVYKQSINANTSLDTVTLKFEEYDGTQITQFIDFRNKNPGAVRNPEEDKGKETHNIDLQLNLDQTFMISPYIVQHCQDGRDSILTEEADLRYLSKSLGRDFNILSNSASRIPTGKTKSCKEVVDMTTPCTCQFTTCIQWYPCGLKYCRGKDSAGKTVNYRCGIKTCKKCRTFEYYVNRKSLCLWDEY